MRKILITCMVAITAINASAQVIDRAQIAQQQRQQASKGAAAAQSANNKTGLVGVAELSSACFKEAQSGSRSSDYCLGIEALGRSVRDSSPDADANAKDWFRHPKMTERVMAHCTLFLGIQDEMSCALRLAAAKMAIP